MLHQFWNNDLKHGNFDYNKSITGYIKYDQLAQICIDEKVIYKWMNKHALGLTITNNDNTQISQVEKGLLSRQPEINSNQVNKIEEYLC